MATLNGSAAAVFAVTLSEANAGVINVGWKTTDGTGVAGTDYVAASGTVTFLPGELTHNIEVMVLGREPADAVGDRSFYIDLTPPVGAILDQARAECVISVVSADDGLFTTVFLPAGPRGRPGDKGNDGLSAYELAVIDGFVGTLAQWLATVTGRNVELRKGVTHIQWRVVGDPVWIDLIAIADLKGDPGNDGQPVQMQKGATHIQWRITGAVNWINLIAIADLKGDKGEALRNRGDWAANTYNPGDYVAAGSSAGGGARSLFFLLDAVPYVSAVEPKSDLTHWVELQPPQGADGREVEMQKGATAIQWRYTGESAWTDLVLLSDLKGIDGKNVALRKSPDNTEVQWQNEGDSTWNTLFLLSLIEGADGKNIELQKNSTHVQWRVVGDPTWINLIALADITGTPGSNGATWFSGTGVPATGAGVINDFYLRNDTGQIYKKTAAAVWTVQMVITVTGNVWLIVTANPSAGTGSDGYMALNTTTGAILQRVSGAWQTLITIPLEATSAEAKAAAITGKYSSPARVREFMEQYGFTSTFTTDATDLNTITGATDRTVIFGFNNTTLNIPFAGAYGRGIMFAGGGNYSTQVVWINGSNDQYVRNHNGASWDAWKKQAFNDNDLITTAWITVTTQNSWTIQAGRRAVYRKVLGLVYLDIDLTGGAFTAGTVLFTLPVGYRPPNLVLFAVFASGNTPRNGSVYIDTNGQVTIERTIAATGEIGFQLAFAVQ